jgi:hypothetical protein
MPNLTIPSLVNSKYPAPYFSFAPTPAIVLKLQQQFVVIGNRRVGVWFLPNGITQQRPPIDATLIGQDRNGTFYARLENY